MGLPFPSSSSSSFLLLLLFFFFFFLPAWALQNVTPQLFGGQAFGTLAAFGDFNSDKQTDLFVLRGDNELNIFLADQKEPYFKPKVKLPLTNVVITSVVPGDYDGDSQMDVLLTTRPQKQPNADLTVWIFWGKNQTLDINRKIVLNRTFHDEPLIMDFNGDLVPDVFGVTNETDKPQAFLGSSLSWQTALDAPNKMYKPHSHAFIDLTNDFTADLFLTTVLNDNQIQFEVWENQNGNFSKATHIKKKPKDAVVVGQSVFADFDGDGQTEHLLPACVDEACQKSVIYLSKPGADQICKGTLAIHPSVMLTRRAELSRPWPGGGLQPQRTMLCFSIHALSSDVFFTEEAAIFYFTLLSGTHQPIVQGGKGEPKHCTSGVPNLESPIRSWAKTPRTHNPSCPRQDFWEL